jgi:hypothetical protein
MTEPYTGNDVLVSIAVWDQDASDFVWAYARTAEVTEDAEPMEYQVKTLRKAIARFIIDDAKVDSIMKVHIIPSGAPNPEPPDVERG